MGVSIKFQSQVILSEFQGHLTEVQREFQGSFKQAEAEVVPSSSLVEVEVG